MASNPPLPLSAETVRQLALLRLHMSEVSVNLAHRHDAVGRIQAIILLDYVAESAVKTVAQTLGCLRKTDKLEEIWGDVAAALTTRGLPALPLRNQINALRGVRNLTQHHGEIPSPESVAKNMASVSSFFESVCDLYGKDAQELTSADLVQDQDVRDLLQKSESALKAGDYQTTLTQARIAFDLALRRSPVAALLYKLDSLPHSWTLDMAGAPKHFLNLIQVLNDVQRQVDHLRNQSFVSRLGLDYVRHLTFLDMAPHTFWPGGPPDRKEPSNIRLTRHEYSPQEARFAFDYVLDVILRLEALPAPSLPVSWHVRREF